jgi:hypothetical protein
MSWFFMAHSWRKTVCAVMKGALREKHGANGLRHCFSPTARPWRNGAEMTGAEPRGVEGWKPGLEECWKPPAASERELLQASALRVGV